MAKKNLVKINKYELLPRFEHNQIAENIPKQSF